jgi:hypothetical protein
MLQITPQMKILVAVEPADFRRGIDALQGSCPRWRAVHLGDPLETPDSATPLLPVGSGSRIGG